jgi:peptidoglycan hydrolase-like protein with peptidoglycan-binding domain
MITPRAARFRRDPELAACLAGRAELGTGLVGPAVAAVQQALMDLGYPLAGYGPDGVFGPETSAAVASFSAAVLGQPDPAVRRRTMAALDTRFATERSTIVDSAPTGQDAPPTPRPAPVAAMEPDEDDPAVVAFASRAVDLAMAAATAGSHVLTGTAGAVPDTGGGTLLHPAGVTLAPGRTDPADPAVFAAHTGGPLCAGRWNARNGGIAGGRPAWNTDTDLIAYLAGLAARPEPEWSPFFSFFSPRATVGVPGTTVVWGEDCRGKRHFDGPGLINWCLEGATGRRRTIDLDPARDGARPVPVTDPPRRGDIVVRSAHGRVTHVGFLTGPDPAQVVVAEQPAVGVVARRFSPAGWTARWRPTAALLRADPRRPT